MAIIVGAIKKAIFCHLSSRTPCASHLIRNAHPNPNAQTPKRLGRSRQAEYAAAIRHSQSVYPAVLPSSFLSYFLCGQTSRNRYTVLPSFLTIMILFGRPFMQRESDRKAGAKKKYRIVKIIMLNFLRPEQQSPPQRGRVNARKTHSLCPFLSYRRITLNRLGIVFSY